MALSGSKSISVTKYNTLVFSWSASQNIDGNYSTVSWKMQLKATSYGRISSTVAKDWSVTVNGVKKSGTNTVGISAGATRTLASGSTKVSHNSDGSKSFSFSFSQEFSITFSGSWIGTKSGSGSATLNTIPRATAPKLSVSTQEFGKSVTISTPRASSNFTHTLQYDFKSGGTFTNIATGVATSYTWTIPTSIMSKAPNEETSYITIKCITYNGSTKIGEKTVRLNVEVPSSVVPSISAITTAEATAGLADKFGAYVQGKSKLNVSIAAAGASGSTIKYYHVEICDYIYTSANFTTYEISESGSVQIKATVTDSRGRTATKTETITVLAYTPPTLAEFDVVRGNSAGEKDDQGTYALITLDMDISPLNNKNDKSYTIQYKSNADTGWKTLLTAEEYTKKGTIIGGDVLSADYTYSFKITVADYFNSVVAEVNNIPSTFSIMDFMATGKGISFGRAAEADNFSAFMEAMLQNKTYVKNHMYLDNDIALAAMLSTGSAASLIRMNPSDQVELNWTTGGLKGRVFKKLWSGTWGSGKITVNELAYYNLFLFELDGTVTRVLAQRIDNNYIRGVACQLTSSGNMILYGVNVIASGTSLTVDAQSTGSPAFSQYVAPNPGKADWRIVLNIWGVL